MPFTSFLRSLSPRNPLYCPSLRKFLHPQKKPCSLSLPIAASAVHCFVSHQAEGKVKWGRKSKCVLLCSSAMDSKSTSLLVLRGKSSAEIEFSKFMKANNALKLPDNGELSILLHPEIEKTEEESFQMDFFMNSLSTNTFGRLLIWSPRLPSTHDLVSHNFCELPIGTVCVADVQLKGRGRSKNEWVSPEGCLLFSFTIQMEDGRTVPLLQYVVSLAITEAIKNVCDSNGLPHLDVKIKWPNDLYLNDLKVGGILCTSTYKSKKFNVSAGIGLNVDNEKPTTCLNAVLRELSNVAYQFRREDILAAFFNKFETFFSLFVNEGFQTLEELYCKTWLHSGQRVIVQEDNKGQMVENVVTVQGLTSSGYLLAIGDDGQMCELHPDGNRLCGPCEKWKLEVMTLEINENTASTSSKDWSGGNYNEEDSLSLSIGDNNHVAPCEQLRDKDSFSKKPTIIWGVGTLAQLTPDTVGIPYDCGFVQEPDIVSIAMWNYIEVEPFSKGCKR